MKLTLITVAQAQRADLAKALLAAADKLGLSASVVVSTSTGYAAPADVLKEAGVELPYSGGDVETRPKPKTAAPPAKGKNK
jgi:hypothetical protein